jgi:hypothetical protein
VLTAGVAVAGIAGYGYTAYLFDAPSGAGWLAMCALLLVQMSAYAALTFLGSTLTRSPLAAAGIGIGVLTVIAIVGALPVIGAWTPSGLAELAVAAAAGGAPDHSVEPILVTMAVTAVALFAAWLSFRRQEL